MKAPERIKLRHQAKTRARQAMHRTRQKEKGLELIQVRISRLSHALASEICETSGISLTELYQLAIENADENNLPDKHAEVIEGDLVGSRQITPWVRPEIASKFDALATHYKTRTIAISAIVYDYCKRCDER